MRGDPLIERGFLVGVSATTHECTDRKKPAVFFLFGLSWMAIRWLLKNVGCKLFCSCK